MKTSAWIRLLAAGAGPVERAAVARRYASALAWGMIGAALTMGLFMGLRPDIDRAAKLPMFWIKLGFPAVLLVGSVAAAARLSRPGDRLGWTVPALLVPLAAMWLAGAVVLSDALPAQRAALVMGRTWWFCVIGVPLLSLPMLVAAFWAMRGLAPTRPVLAGAMSGLVAGTVGALVYALHCPEMQAPFFGVWYVAGMLVPAATGALVGPRLLRW